ncbi:unnamed protein product [Rangifer tarandus platyrhynchus]|uniref:Uncharacterized protein n=1 Tax=Rangifer tarandus platyrhynchus TaxID=3082113 RepID=A0AC59ZB32_RANTA
MCPWQFQSLQVENVSQTPPDPSPTVCWAGHLPIRPLAVPSVQRAKNWQLPLRRARTEQEAPENVKLTASLGTPESWGHRVPAGAPARGESGSTPRPGAEDPGEAQANSLQECTSAERGIRRGYKSPERADVEETHSHLQGPVDLGGTHRDGQGSHGSTLACGPGVADQQMPHQWQASLLPASPPGAQA